MSNIPAFPTNNFYDSEGVTLRDYFAAQAIGPLMGSDGFENEILAKGFPLAAEQAYEIADAMLAAREKGGGK